MNKFQQGFTLIELMIVVAILGILAAIALPMYQDYISKSQMTRVVNESADLKTAIDAHLAEHPDLKSVKDPAGNPAASPTDRAVALGFTGSNLLDNTKTSTLLGTIPAGAEIGVPEVDEGVAGKVNVVATLGSNANSATAGAIVTLKRSEQGVWSCEVKPSSSSGWKDKFIPGGCTKGA